MRLFMRAPTCAQNLHQFLQRPLAERVCNASMPGFSELASVESTRRSRVSVSDRTISGSRSDWALVSHLRRRENYMASKKVQTRGSVRAQNKGNEPTQSAAAPSRRYRNAQVGDQRLPRAPSGETHQQADEDTFPLLTTAQGVPISDDQNSLRVGTRGPQLLEDFVLRDKLFHFDHERIPERVVHARGYGAHGFFENYQSLSALTRADLFQRPGEQTPVFVRFSTVAGNKGSADLARDVRGFAVKLYTKEGNWDLVGNNIPVFFIQDAMKFPDLVHAAKQEPDRDFPQAQTAHDNFWDFISLSPESMHMVMWIMSDRTIPRSLRFMEGFGVHTFRLVNARGRSSFVKFHWKPKLGMQSVVWNEALKLNGADPDFHRRDLWDAISADAFPEWELGLQVFDEKFAARFPFDVLDPTKLIPEEEVPVQRVGRLVLNRLVDNFFAETEQVAFCTQNIVPGIDFSDDPLLQGRNFSYLDTQLKRLGSPNFTQLPINAPKCPFAHFQQDGHMAMTNPRGRVNYEPNSWEEGPRESTTRGFTSYPAQLVGPKLRARGELFADHYSQARQFYISQTAVEQAHIQDALIFELSKVEMPPIRERMVSHLRNIDEELAQGVAMGLGLRKLPKPAEPARAPITNLKPSPALSILQNPPPSFEGRKLGVLVTDGTDAKLLQKLTRTFKGEGAVVELIAPTVGGVLLSDGTRMPAKQKLEGGPSVLYDAVAVLIGEDEATRLAKVPAARDFVADAFAHCKVIGYVASAQALFVKAGVSDSLDEGFVALDGRNGTTAFLTRCRALRFWERQATMLPSDKLPLRAG
jgi:catalase